MIRKKPVSGSNPRDLESRLAGLFAPAPGPDLADRLLEIPHRPERAPRRSAPALRRIRLALAAGLALAGLAGGVFLATRPTPAFAEVERALEKVRTVSWTEERSIDGIPPPAAAGNTTQVWAQTDPPALYRQQRNGGRSLFTERGIHSYEPFRKRYEFFEHPANIRAHGGPRNLILAQILAPGYPGGPLNTNGWKVGREVLEGVPRLRFTQEFRWGLDGRPAFLPNPDRYERRNSTMIWVDPQTYRIVRTEHRQWDTRDNRLEAFTLTSNYRYDETPPAGTFVWKVPAGAKEENTTRSEVWQRNLGAEEKAAVQAVINQVTAAYVAHDFQRFAAAWDFGYPDRFPRSKTPPPWIQPTAAARMSHWKTHLAALQARQRVPWKSWTTEVSFVMATRYHFALGSLPKSEPEFLEVHTQSRITREDGRTYDDQTVYWLTKQHGRYRVFLWQQNAPYEFLWGG